MKKLRLEEYDKYREKKSHGDADFPFSIYDPCVIPDMFPEVMTHWHEEMEIIYIKEGIGIVSVNLESYKLQAPALVFVLPGQLHSIRQSENHRMNYENIIFHPRLLYSRYGGICDIEYLQPLFEDRVDIPTILDSSQEIFAACLRPLIICNEADCGEPGYPLLVKSQLFTLCYQLLRNYPVNEKSIRDREKVDRIKPVLSYIASNYGENIRVADAASCMGFSESHFMRSFREIMGVSFVAYLKDYRLSRAEELLRTTKQSVLEIAQETGFDNFSYFIRLFKAKYGRTPLKYRDHRWDRQ